MAKKKSNRDDFLVQLIKTAAWAASVNSQRSPVRYPGSRNPLLDGSLGVIVDAMKSSGLSSGIAKMLGLGPAKSKKKDSDQANEKTVATHTGIGHAQASPADASSSEPMSLQETITTVARAESATKQPSDADLQEVSDQTGLSLAEVRRLFDSGQLRFQDAASNTEEPPSLNSVITGASDKQSESTPVMQPTVPGVPAKKPKAASGPASPQSKTSVVMDALQLALDAIGVLDPTPIADGTNALISVGRAVFTDPKRRKEHLQNAAISAVSMVPYVGDAAKLAKLPRAAKTVQRTAQAVRGVDRAADATKAMTAAEKRAARKQYRESAKSATDSVLGPNDDSEMQETVSQHGTSAAGGNGGSRVPPGSVASPDPGDDPSNRGGINQAREQAEGISKYDEWTEKLKDAAGKVADFGGILGKAAAKASAFVGSLQLLNTGVLALNRSIAPYSGQLASAYAQADAADIRRDMRKADALDGPLSGLSTQQTELKDKLQEALLPLQVVGIKTLEELTRLTNDALDFFGGAIKITPFLKEAIELLKNQNGKDNDTAVKTFFQDVSDGKFDGKRPDFMPPRRQILDNPDHGEVFR